MALAAARQAAAAVSTASQERTLQSKDATETVHPGDAGAGRGTPGLESVLRADTCEVRTQTLPPWEWTVEDVQSYLGQHGLADIQGTFRDHNVTGMVLLSLSEEDMRDALGIWKFGPRRELMLRLQECKAMYRDRSGPFSLDGVFDKTQAVPEEGSANASALSGRSEGSPSQLQTPSTPDPVGAAAAADAS